MPLCFCLYKDPPEIVCLANSTQEPAKKTTFCRLKAIFSGFLRGFKSTFRLQYQSTLPLCGCVRTTFSVLFALDVAIPDSKSALD